MGFCTLQLVRSDERFKCVGQLRCAVIEGQQRTPVDGQLDQALVLLVGVRPEQHFLQRLDLARQAAVLAVDEHGDQGWIWLGDGDNSLPFLP